MHVGSLSSEVDRLIEVQLILAVFKGLDGEKRPRTLKEGERAVLSYLHFKRTQLLFYEWDRIYVEAMHGDFELDTAPNEVEVHHCFRSIRLADCVEDGFCLLHDLGHLLREFRDL